MLQVAKKITLFLTSGIPGGIREVSIDQWDGGAICGPRNKIDEILKYDAVNSPSLYFLVGDIDEGGLLQIYVGEADPFNERIKDHIRKKDWWQQAVVFYGKSDNPTKTGIQYLESVTLERLKEAARCRIENRNAPKPSTVNRFDVPGLEQFYENITLIMPILGFDIFIQKVQQDSNTGTKIFCTSSGVNATAILLDDGKVKVEKGSTAVKENRPSFMIHNYKKLKDELISLGRLTDASNKDFLVFADDYYFNSLSAAAAVVLARSAQGPKEWKNEKGIPLGDLE